MELIEVDQAPFGCHILAIPYPGRGHINPLMNLCKLIAAATSTPIHLLQISFIVTEEWFSILKSEPKPDNIQFRTIPNVIPSEKDRSKDLPGFMEAVFTKMEAPVDSKLDGFPKPNVILADSFLPWAVSIGERRNIPVASFWTPSATVFSIHYHYQLLKDNGHYEANFTGAVIIPIKLTGSDNYGIWSRSMRIALLGKRKFGFVTGVCSKESCKDEWQEQWETCNAIVLSWLMNTVAEDLLGGIVYATSAHKVWEDLKERFDKVNRVRIYQLHREITTLAQGTDSISTYFSKLKNLWSEYDAVVPSPSCECVRSKDYVDHLYQLRLIHLDD